MPSVFCTQCGRPNPDDARFCSNCGNPLVRGVPQPSYESPGESTSTISLSGLEAALESDQVEEQGSAPDQIAVDALPPGTALLIVRRGPNAGSRFLLDKDRTSAGRHPESDIFLDDVTVSRRHAEFRRDGSRFVVHDVGSLNGTYVNRQRVEDTELANGDELQIGKFKLTFFAGE